MSWSVVRMGVRMGIMMRMSEDELIWDEDEDVHMDEDCLNEPQTNAIR